MHGSDPAVPGTLPQPGGERVQGVWCGGRGGLSVDLPCYCPELHGSYLKVPGTLPQRADAHVEVLEILSYESVMSN